MGDDDSTPPWSWLPAWRTAAGRLLVHDGPAFTKSPCWRGGIPCGGRRLRVHLQTVCRSWLGKDGQLLARYDKSTSSMWDLPDGNNLPQNLEKTVQRHPPYRRCRCARALAVAMFNLLDVRFPELYAIWLELEQSCDDSAAFTAFTGKDPFGKLLLPRQAMKNTAYVLAARADRLHLWAQAKPWARAGDRSLGNCAG